jgi:hypothetical protein
MYYAPGWRIPRIQPLFNIGMCLTLGTQAKHSKQTILILITILSLQDNIVKKRKIR